MADFLSKSEAAANQLDWAIRLFFDEEYIPAITLAGAAEEILGAPLGEAAIFNVLRAKLAAESNLSPADVSQNHLNKSRNWLKHWAGLRDEERIEIELRTEALQFIVRAMSNYLDHNLPATAQGDRFLEWVVENRAAINSA
jgi:hypothetical protein